MSPDLRLCACEQPNRSPNLLRRGTCCKCGLTLGPDWDTTDANLVKFMERVELGFPSWPETPDSWQTLRLQATHREAAGRDYFGHRYLDRCNVTEAREELADTLIYLHLECLKLKRAGEEPEMDVVLDVAEHLAEAYRGLGELRNGHTRSLFTEVE